MHWRFVDKVESFQPWRGATGRKAVSLEEYSLYEPFGRKGVLPESLVLESCVQLVRWLVAASSGFKTTCVLGEIEAFSLLSEARMGGVLAIEATVLQREPDRIRAECRVRCGGGAVAQGILAFDLASLEAGFDPVATEGIWRELYGSS